jgi:hypothetical protein
LRESHHRAVQQAILKDEPARTEEAVETDEAVRSDELAGPVQQAILKDEPARTDEPAKTDEGARTETCHSIHAAHSFCYFCHQLFNAQKAKGAIHWPVNEFGKEHGPYCNQQCP